MPLSVVAWEKQIHDSSVVNVTIHNGLQPQSRRLPVKPSKESQSHVRTPVLTSQQLHLGEPFSHTIFYPDVYARHDLIIESACLWLIYVNSNHSISPRFPARRPQSFPGTRVRVPMAAAARDLGRQKEPPNPPPFCCRPAPLHQPAPRASKSILYIILPILNFIKFYKIGHINFDKYIYLFFCGHLVIYHSGRICSYKDWVVAYGIKIELNTVTAGPISTRDTLRPPAPLPPRRSWPRTSTPLLPPRGAVPPLPRFFLPLATGRGGPRAPARGCVR